MRRELRMILATAHPGIDFYTNGVCCPQAAVVVWVARRIGVSPNHLTAMSLALALAAAAVLVWRPSPIGWLMAGSLIHVSYVLDSADGMLARCTGRISLFGWRFDLYADRLKEALLLGGLACTAGNGAAAWAPAAAAGWLYSMKTYLTLNELLRAPRLYRVPPKAPVGFGVASVTTLRRVLRRVDGVIGRFNFGVFNIGEFYLIVVAGLVIGQPGPMLWGLAAYGLAAVAWKTLTLLVHGANLSHLSATLDGETSVVIAGAGQAGQHALARLSAQGLAVAAFADSNASMTGRRVAGLEVIGLKDIATRFPKPVVLIASVHHHDIERELLGNGMREERIGIAV